MVKTLAALSACPILPYFPRLSLYSAMAAAAKPSGGGGESAGGGGTGGDGDGFSEVDNWLGSSSLPTQRAPSPERSPSPPSPPEWDLERRAAAALARKIRASGVGEGHEWASGFSGVW